jgi:divalent metal cation (Fe/Co/Zn/Cd) transporter
MDKKNLRKKDLIASLILLAVSIFVLVDSFRMIFFTNLPGVKDIGWFVAPGVFPFILSVGLIIMSLIMLSIAYRESGRIKLESWRKFSKYFKSKDTFIMMAEIGLLFFMFLFFLRSYTFYLQL